MMGSFVGCLAILAVVSASPLKELGGRDGCSQDNCYRALDGFQRTSEAAFCSEYLHTSTMIVPAVVAAIELCGPHNISSGCSCLMTAAASVSTQTAAGAVTTVTVPGAGPNTITITLTPPVITAVSTVTATINSASTDINPTTTPDPICPLANETTIVTSRNNATGDQPPGTTSLYTVHCQTGYNPGDGLFASAATGLQQCAQQCTDYTCQHTTECTAAAYSFGRCYGRSGTLKERAIQYADAMS
ncbi:MAG: hypothetical protein FRX48_04021 [Lasallia pustulata]|uniref:Apple domain-containing protein n=1 Tax=Lasallia pustulata TaxID=136370 RepID=A0A5M8PQS2_9LECA|nr:MAG: hypothetical protein FRX48_04021 [Lasallia pustulata]